MISQPHSHCSRMFRRSVWLTLTALLAGFVINWTHAAERFRTYVEAQAKANEEGIIVYLYGPNWNKRSVKMLQSFWESPDTAQAAGNSTLVAIPIYQRPTPEQKLEQDEIGAGFTMPPAYAYRSNPTVVMQDKAGNTYAILAGSDDLGSGLSGKRAQELIRKNKKLLARRLELMTQAEKATGIDKARLIGEACTLGIAGPSSGLEQIKQLDPNDETGYIRRLTFDPRRFQGEHANDDTDTLEKAVMKIVNDKAYSTLQRQETYCLLIGKLRRDGATASVLRKHIQAMGAIDPESMYGKITDDILHIWCGAPAPEESLQGKDKQKTKKKRSRRSRS